MSGNSRNTEIRWSDSQGQPAPAWEKGAVPYMSDCAYAHAVALERIAAALERVAARLDAQPMLREVLTAAPNYNFGARIPDGDAKMSGKTATVG